MARRNSINNESQDLTLDPGAAGDSFVQFDINTTSKFRIGVDDDSADAFKISQGNTLGANDTFVMTAAGQKTMPLQPAFLAVLDSTISDVTGDGTAYTVVWDTEVFDQNNDFDGTSTFTAPVTGRYMFNISLLLDDLTGNHDIYLLEIVASNRILSSGQPKMSPARDVNTQYGYCLSALVDMDASDTAIIRITVTNDTKVVDLLSNGSTDPYNWFSGSLVC